MAEKIKVRHPDGRVRLCGAGTEDKALAAEIRAWVLGLKRAGRLDIVEAIVSGRVKLTDAYRLRATPDAILAVPGSRNVEPLVKLWHAEKSASRKGASSADKYLDQVRKLIPEGKPFSAALLAPERLRKWLRGLDVSDPTRNRYKAALSSFCAYLVDEGVIARNPIAEVGGFAEGEGRSEWYSIEQADRVIERIDDQEMAGAFALACTAGLEFSVLAKLRRRDVNLEKKTVWADGGKNRWRRRESRILPKLETPAMSREIAAVCAGKLPDALLFPSLGGDSRPILGWIERAAKAAKLPALTLHDQRHTFAVNALKAGYKPQAVSHCLGHRDTTLVWNRYGRYVSDERDFSLGTEEVREVANG